MLFFKILKVFFKYIFIIRKTTNISVLSFSIDFKPNFYIRNLSISIILFLFFERIHYKLNFLYKGIKYQFFCP